MVLDKFEVGKRYRFNKELFKLMFGDSVSGWEDNIHLHEVTIIDNRDGYIECYSISPKWCEEIVTEPLKTRDDIKDMYKQVLYLEELEETLDTIDEHMSSSSQMESDFVKYINFEKYINSEIERIKEELGLEE